MSETDLKDRALIETNRESNGVRGATEVLFVPEVRDFCTRHGILEYVRIAIDLAQRHFPSVQDLSLHLTQDPETDEEWVVIDITIQGEVDKVLEDYNRYTEQWIVSVPWPERDKICLSYNIL